MGAGTWNRISLLFPMLLSACGLGIDPFPNEDLVLPASQVQITAPPYPLIADGLDKVSIEVRFQDLRNRGVPGIVPSFALSGSGGSLTCDPSNAQGVALCFLGNSISGVTQLTLLEPPIPVAPVSIEAVGTDAFQYRIQGGGQVELPLLASGIYSGLKVYWGDGTSSLVSGAGDPARFHTYADSSERVVTLTGSFNRLSFFGHGPERLLDVRFWGSNGFTSFADMFRGCNQLTGFSALDPPNTSGVLDFSGAFQDATEFNWDIGAWDVSAATHLSRMFKGAEKFNQPLGGWNVRNVTDFSEMFSASGMDFNAPTASDDPAYPMAFNQPLRPWDTGSGVNFSKMFAGAMEFKQDLSSWQMGAATDLSGMFFHAHAFNGAVDTWSVASVTDMTCMFREARAFNQPLTNWETGSLYYLKGMFRGALSFNQDASDLDTGLVVDFSEVFMNATEFNNGGGGLSWNTSSATDMSYMFFGATRFNQGLDFDVGGVTNFDSMFYGASVFNANITAWQLTAAQSVNSMFQDASSFNQNLSEWRFHSTPTSANFDLGASSWADQHKPIYLRADGAR